MDIGFPTRKKLTHHIPPWVDERSFYFVTICTEPRGQNHLCNKNVGDVILKAASFYHEQCKWHCRLMLLMPDHLHGIIAFARDLGMRSLLASWKRYLTKQTAVQWQSGFFDHRLRDRFQVEEKMSYVLNNPVRAGLCKDVNDWPFVYRPMDRWL